MRVSHLPTTLDGETAVLEAAELSLFLLLGTLVLVLLITMLTLGSLGLVLALLLVVWLLSPLLGEVVGVVVGVRLALFWDDDDDLVFVSWMALSRTFLTTKKFTKSTTYSTLIFGQYLVTCKINNEQMKYVTLTLHSLH